MKRGNARENRKQLVDSPFSTGHRNMACNAANDGYKPVKMQSTKTIEKGDTAMIIVKNTTKKAQNMIGNYNWYTNRNGLIDIHQAYGSPSIYKVRAWYSIKEMCERMHGYGLTVLGHNCMKYSAAFKAVEDGAEKLFYFTADYDYCVEL